MTDITPSWAVPGAKVVCVTADLAASPDTIRTDGNMDGLTSDRVYTIRETVVDHVTSLLALRLHEIHRGGYPGRPERGYWIGRFRPAVEPKSEAEDTAMFERIAHGATIVEKLDRLRELLDASP